MPILLYSLVPEVLLSQTQDAEHLVWRRMASGTLSPEGGEAFVYRVSTAEEWEELQSKGATLGRDLDRRTGCIHLCSLRQVRLPLLPSPFLP